MTTYRVEIDGEEVWSGEGDDYKVIPAEYRDRPANAAPGDPHPSPHVLFEGTDDFDDDGVPIVERIIGVQVSLDHEDELASDPDQAADRWAALTVKAD